MLIDQGKRVLSVVIIRVDHCKRAINDRCAPPLLEFPLIFIPWGVEAAVLIWYAVSSSRAMKDYF